ncbi:GTP pyrophosphokinase [Clostridia bacterium]|nr:GTP pyrophosphokinase [Clostridia bacterium]
MVEQIKKDEEMEVCGIPKDFTDPEVLYRQLVENILAYHPSEDMALIEKAYDVAKKAHIGQQRKSGESYIIHPLCVALLLTDLKMDKETLAAALLHDAVEDTYVTLSDIQKEFGKEIAILVDGVTKLTHISMDKMDNQAENLRKMFLAMSKDIRVIMVKLADRLHNMRTLKYMTEAKQKEKAKETMEIYAPIAHRLGIAKIKVELDDLSLKYLHPDVYYSLVDKINLRKSERQEFIAHIVEEITDYFQKKNLKVQVQGRFKHFFSIYKKMLNQNKKLEEIHDLFAVRILVEDPDGEEDPEETAKKTKNECYRALGLIHELYKSVAGRFKDYISMPKLNNYQSLHTSVLDKNGRLFEVQIRTQEMHKVAEYGIAAHWQYKESGSGQIAEQAEQKKAHWLRTILELQQDIEDNEEYLTELKEELDLFADNIYCFTPCGDVKNLPAGSTTIDFAYSIHSAVGNKMVGARVNGKLVPIETVVQNGDRIEILTSHNTKGPSRDWLNVVKSTQAKHKIMHWFKTEFKEENILRGKDLLEKYCKGKNLILSDLLKADYEAKVMQKYGFQDWESVLSGLGHGGLKEGQIVNRLLEEKKKNEKKKKLDADILQSVAENKEKISAPKSKNGILVKGVHDLAVHFSKCCNPVPGDEIVGFVTRGRGISVHRTDCINIIHLSPEESERLIDAEWEEKKLVQGEKNQHKHLAKISIFAYQRMGLFADVSHLFDKQKIELCTMDSRINKQGQATMTLSFFISGKNILEQLISKLRQIESIVDIERKTG